MNYRHAYHAGNFADVFKHVILTLCLENFHKKDTPFFVLDTHAGIGKYDLDNDKSLKTNEAENGIKKFIKNNNCKDLFSIPNYQGITPIMYCIMNNSKINNNANYLFEYVNKDTRIT